MSSAAETATLCTRCGAPLLRDPGPCVACKPTEESIDLPARIGPFRIGSRLGVGPRGTVYRARHDGSDRDVALKVLIDIERVSQSCLRQARAVARMRHPNILGLRSIGRVRGVPFIAGELFNGRSLDEVLRLRGALGAREALLIARATASGLAAALEEDILHRGVKATNIFVSAQGDVRIADFGHSPRAGTEDEFRAGLIAPERVSDEPIDQRADIWSLGMVLFQMLTGERALARFEGGRPSFRGHLADTGPALRTLVQDMVAVELERRIPTYERVLTAIDASLAELDAQQSLEEESAQVAPGRMRVAGLAAVALLIGVGTMSSSSSSAAVATPFHESAAATNAPLTLSTPPAPPTYDAQFDYMLGSAAAAARFVALESRVDGSRAGGRLQLERGEHYAVVHDTPVGGDIDLALSFVLEPRSEVAILLRTDDGRRVAAMFRTGAAHGVELLAGQPLETIAAARVSLRHGRPYLIEVRRHHGQTTIAVDGDVVLVGDAPLSGAYRVGLAAPRGGAELRSLRWRAEDRYDA